MLASRQFVWSKPYQRRAKPTENDGNSENKREDILDPIYSEPIDIENNAVYYDTIKKSDTDKKTLEEKPPVPRSQRLPLKDRSNTNNLLVKEAQKKRSKSLSGFSSKKSLPNNERGN